jgi:LCP family protein required for cell wall assembly
MIEERLREAFARHESAVPDAARLVPAIDAEARRRRGRRRWARSTAAAFALLVAVAGAPLLGRAWLTGQLGAAGPASTGAALNFLIVGLDRSPARSSDARAAADAIIVAHVPRDRSAVYLLSIPRDLSVRFPSTGIAGGTINGAYADGGWDMVARTVTQLTGVDFDGGATIKLDRLAGLVDDLGGVRFCIDQWIRSIHTGRTFAPGCYQMTGAEARDFLRQRKDYPDGSIARSWYLARFLGALLRQVGAPETLGSLDRLRAVVATVRRHVDVDTGGVDAVQLAWNLRSAARTVVDLGVPVEVAPPPPGLGVPAVQVTRDADALFDALRRDTLDAWVAANPDRGQRVRW